MIRTLRIGIAIALMSAWAGAALIVATTVAPAAFEVLPSRALAGLVVGEVLPVVFMTGIMAAAAAASLVWRASRAAGIVALLSAVACAGAQFVVGARIANLRAAIGPALDALAVDDPQRLEFGRLHAVSVGLMGVALIGALVFLVLSLRALRQRQTESVHV